MLFLGGGWVPLKEDAPKWAKHISGGTKKLQAVASPLGHSTGILFLGVVFCGRFLSEFPGVLRCGSSFIGDSLKSGGQQCPQ